jgi:hypothetical protein
MNELLHMCTCRLEINLYEMKAAFSGSMWLVEAMLPKTEQRGKMCRQRNVNANQIGVRRWPPMMHLSRAEGLPPVLGEPKSRGMGGP